MKRLFTVVLVIVSILLMPGCTQETLEEEQNISADFVDKEWLFYDEVTAEHLCLYLGSDGSYSYHCECGESVGDSDLYDQYEYNAETNIITIFADSENETEEIKILGYNEFHLMIEIDGEVKDFCLEAMDTTSNFFSFEAGDYFTDYESRCTVADIVDNKITYSAVNYDPEGLYEDGPFEEYDLTENVEFFELRIHRFNSIQGDQEYEEFYNLYYKKMNGEEAKEYIGYGSALTFLWFDEELKVEKVVFYGETSVTADYMTVEVTAEEAGEITQEELDEKAEEGYFEAAHLNGDGSVLYLVLKEQYESFVSDMK